MMAKNRQKRETRKPKKSTKKDSPLSAPVMVSTEVEVLRKKRKRDEDF